MNVIIVEDTETGHSVQRTVSAHDLAALSGVQLAALLFPNPTEADVATLNEFLAHYRDSSTVGTR